MLAGLLALLIVFPSLRRRIFPPAPATPMTASNDGPPPLPERHKGERAEEEASEFVSNLAVFAMDSSSARYGQSDVDESLENSANPDGSLPTEGMPEVPPIDSTSTTPPKEKKTPMKKKASSATNQAMRVISDITDGYERFAK